MVRFTKALPTRGYVACAKLGDLDVLNSEFSIDGSAAGELHITVRGDNATLQGQVTSQGRPAPGAQIYLVPASDSAAFRLGIGDTEGHYKIPNVPPGDYRIHAWLGEPSAKDISSGAGETLTLQPSEQRTMSLEATQAEQK